MLVQQGLVNGFKGSKVVLQDETLEIKKTKCSAVFQKKFELLKRIREVCIRKM